MYSLVDGFQYDFLLVCHHLLSWTTTYWPNCGLHMLMVTVSSTLVKDVEESDVCRDNDCPFAWEL